MNKTFNNVETAAHIAIDLMAAAAKGIVTIVLLLGYIAFRGGQSTYELLMNWLENEVRECQPINYLPEVQPQEVPVTVLESEYEVVIVPVAAATDDPWQQLETCEEAYLELDNNININIKTITLDTAQKLLPQAPETAIITGTITTEYNDTNSYKAPKRGRCRKGYRRIGNMCVLITALEAISK